MTELVGHVRKTYLAGNSLVVTIPKREIIKQDIKQGDHIMITVQRVKYVPA